MLKTFKEFLQEQAEQVRAEEAAKEAKKDQWVSAIEDLIVLMKTWLRENDPEKLLKLRERELELSDESVGAYTTTSLAVWLGGRVVRIEPVALDVMGPKFKPRDGVWSGRVDLVGSPFTYKMYRFLDEGGHQEWFIYNENDFHLRPFDREQFEAALLSLFS